MASARKRPLDEDVLERDEGTPLPSTNKRRMSAPLRLVAATAQLVTSAADLHDERQVLRALVGAGFSAGDAVALSEQAIVCARANQNRTPTESHHEQR